MACMEHWCNECKEPVFDNEMTGPRICPSCLKVNPRWSSFCDELPDREEEFS